MRLPINKDLKNIRQKDQGLNQMELIDLFGKIDFDPKYDYKVQRNFHSLETCHSRAGGNPEK
ncbi:hypothetical protein DSCW_38220 [Desulfosarcina widdelii]|uniref:Uncharacterized protein n=1 Tax=Desulfosarcina widdelii TaxID=947919 RepID=A0A5K7Z6R1_9BACT|nr:hypothetical protein DSCW_38220 [Desulfosarcina widdelii]